MVIELLTFQVDPAERDAWLDVEERTWSRFLETCPGFVRKEIWTDRERPDEVHAVIWWTDEATWFSIPQERIDAVDASMGAWFRAPVSMRIYDVRREC